MNSRIIGTWVCIAAGCVNVAIARPFTEHSESQQTLRYAQAVGRTLDVRAIEGAITVEGYDGRDVEMLIKKSISAETQGDLRDAENEVMLDTSDDATTVKAIVRYPHDVVCGERGDRNKRSEHWSEPRYRVRYDFTVRVPRNTRIELCTINEGNIVVSGVQSDFVVRSVNGRITMMDMAGSGQATTVNGGVTASFTAAPRAASLFKTINGHVIVTMPDNLAADLRMKTFNGGLFTDFEVQAVPTATAVNAERSDGKFIYRSNGYTSVRVGAGGPELTLDTLNGDVRVLKRAK